jgi:hypothetical protein
MTQTHSHSVLNCHYTLLCVPVYTSVKDKDDPLQDKQYYDSTGLKRLLLAELARDGYGFFTPPLLKRKMLPWGR